MGFLDRPPSIYISEGVIYFLSSFEFHLLTYACVGISLTIQKSAFTLIKF